MLHIRKVISTLLTFVVACLVFAATSHTAAAQHISCTSLTPAAIQGVIDKIAESRAKAESDAAAHGTTGTYASAARDNLAYLTEAHDQMVALQTWLSDQELDSPYVTNATAAYNVHGYVREVVVKLHYARHWATISATYHTSTDARDSFELTSQAIDLAEALGVQGGRCYMYGYLPSS